jgi:alkanesulfonate monooxygenase SsuD/methylene tetrahydromethanopterin reductase-like flavin-dependent oxidoreductase (luciferase family)
MLPGPFFLGVGTGANLNEHVLWDRWPSASERREMLEEAVELMRLLWQGDMCSFEGKHYRVDDARIYTLPNEPIDLVVAAGGPLAAELAGHASEVIPGVRELETTSAGAPS